MFEWQFEATNATFSRYIRPIDESSIMIHCCQEIKLLEEDLGEQDARSLNEAGNNAYSSPAQFVLLNKKIRDTI